MGISRVIACEMAKNLGEAAALCAYERRTLCLSEGNLSAFRLWHATWIILLEGVNS